VFGAEVASSEVLTGRSNMTALPPASGESGPAAVRSISELRLFSQSRDSPSKFWT